jgi:hypothetical protein
MVVFWDIAPCTLVETQQISEMPTAFIVRSMKMIMDEASTSETSMNFYQSTRRNTPEKSSSYLWP